MVEEDVVTVNVTVLCIDANPVESGASNRSCHIMAATHRDHNDQHIRFQGIKADLICNQNKNNDICKLLLQNSNA